MNKNILLSLLMLIPIVSNAKNDLVKGKLIYQNEDIKLYADTPKKEFDDKIDKAIQSLTPAQVNAAFNKFISPSKLVVIKAGDFEKNVEKKP